MPVNGNKVMLFGDSILKGVVLGEQDGKYAVRNRLELEGLSEEYGITISNQSKFGCTVSKAYRLIEQLLGTKTKPCDYMVLEYGGNDCNFDWKEIAATPDSEHLPATPPESFFITYAALLSLLKSKGIQPILANLPPISSEKFLSWVCRGGLCRDSILQWLGDRDAIYRFHERYSRMVERLAAENGCPLLDLRGVFLEKRSIEDYICCDGMHPDEKGQKLIREGFARFLQTGAAPV